MSADTTRDGLAERGSSRVDALWCAGLAVAIGALALYVRWSNFFGVVRVDSFHYVDAALGLLRREVVFADAGAASVIHAVRLSIILPLAATFQLVGASERTSVLWPLVCSVGSVLVVFLIGLRLGGWLVAATAALVMALYPPEIFQATQLLPDAIVPFFAALAAYCYIRGDEEPTPRAAATWLLLGGCALGLAYYARLNGPVLLVFLLPYSLLRGTLGPRHLWVGAGALGVVAAGELFFAAQGSTPGFGVRTQLATSSEMADVFRPWGPLAPPLGFARMLLLEQFAAAWTVAFLAGVAILVALRPRRWWVGPLWFGTLFLYLELLSQVPITTLPEKSDRMLTILAAPLSLTIAASAVGTLTRLRSAAARAVILSALVLVALPTIVLPSLRAVPAVRARYEDGRSILFRQIAAALYELPGRTVHFVNDWRAPVSLYAGFDRVSLSSGGPARTARTRSGEPVILEIARLDDNRSPIGVDGDYVVHDIGVMLRRPISWQPVVGVDESVTIYHVPIDADHRRWVVHLEPELFEGIAPDQDSALQSIGGWASYSQPYYSRGKAAIARLPAAVMRRQIPPIPAGPLELRVRVYDYGNAGTNRVRLTLNGTDVAVAWSGPAPGVRDLLVPIETTRHGGELHLEAISNGQGFIIVDAIDVAPLGGAD